MANFQSKLALVLMSAHVSIVSNVHAAGDVNSSPTLQQAEFEALIPFENQADLLLNILKTQIDNLIQSFMDVILVISETGAEADVASFYRQLRRVVENPIGFFVVNEIIKQAERLESFELSIHTDEAKLKDCRDDFQICIQSICQKYSIPDDNDKFTNIFKKASKYERGMLVRLQKQCSAVSRILSYKKQFRAKRYLLQVNSLSVDKLSPLKALSELEKMSFTRSTQFDQTGQITFTSSEDVKCTYGWSDDDKSFILTTCPAEFLFFHELLHFAHSLIEPVFYSRFIKKEMTDRSFLDCCLDFPGAASIIQHKRVDDYKNIANVFSSSGSELSMPHRLVFGPDPSSTNIAHTSATNGASGAQESSNGVDKKILNTDVLLPLIDPEELFTILGPDKQKLSPIYTVNENSFRLLHNYFHGTIYHLRFGHRLQNDLYSSILKPVLMDTRKRAVAGVQVCLKCLCEGVKK